MIDGGLLFDAVLALGAVFAELLLRVNESPLLVDFLPLEIADSMRQSDVFLLEDPNLICKLLHSEAQAVAF